MEYLKTLAHQLGLEVADDDTEASLQAKISGRLATMQAAATANGDLTALLQESECEDLPALRAKFRTMVSRADFDAREAELRKLKIDAVLTQGMIEGKLTQADVTTSEDDPAAGWARRSAEASLESFQHVLGTLQPKATTASVLADFTSRLGKKGSNRVKSDEENQGGGNGPTKVFEHDGRRYKLGPAAADYEQLDVENLQASVRDGHADALQSADLIVPVQ